MPDEVNDQRNSAAQSDGRGKEIPQRGNADEKYQGAEDGENGPCDATPNPQVRHIDLRTRSVFWHTAPSDTKVSRIYASKSFGAT